MTDAIPSLPPLTTSERQRQERLEALFLQYYEPLCAFASSRRATPLADAEDAVQSAFETLLTRNGHLLDAAEDPVHRAWEIKNYLYRSVVGRVFHQRRDAVRRQDQLEEYLRDPTVTSLQIAQPERPDWIVEGDELARHVSAALRQLSDRERRVIQLVCLQQCTHQTAATRLGVSPGAVQVFLRRGKAKLTRLLAPWLAPADGVSPPGVSCKMEGEGSTIGSRVDSSPREAPLTPRHGGRA